MSSDGGRDNQSRLEQFEKALEGAWAAYRRGDCDAGIALVEQALDSSGNNGRAWYTLAVLQERAGRLMDADRAFHRATRAMHEPQAPPCRLSWARFLRAVEQAADRLPDELREALQEIDLVLADHPSSEQLFGEDDDELFGLFTGPCKGDRGHDDSGTLTPSIHIFRRAHEHAVSSALEFDAEIENTLYHELGHYLGFDEDDMGRFGVD